MTFTFPEGLAPEVYPLAWLVGQWRGPGFISYPDIPERPVVTETEFASDGGPYLLYRSTTWLLDGELASLEERVDAATLRAGQLWSTESGFWRVTPTVPDDARTLTDSGPTPAGGGERVEIEVLVSDASGYATTSYGHARGPQVEFASETIMRTASAAAVAAERRIYGLVRSELFWATDLAAFGHELQSYASGRLQRQDGATDPE
jgi:hypothetical protein